MKKNKWERGETELIFTTVVCIAILAGLFFCVATYDATLCTNKGHIMGFESRYDFFSGCFYEVEDGRWVDSDAYYYEGQPRQ
jgi:hypothetical protein